MGASGSKTPRASTKQARKAGAMFDDVELHVIKLTYKDLAGLSRSDKRGEAIDKATFLQNFPVPGLVGDRLFAALDKNGTGKISFDDFVVGLAVCCRGSMEEKMRFIFGVYDMDGDGLISRDELLLMLNQVPRTLLSIGGAANGDISEISPPLSTTGDMRFARRGTLTPSHARGGVGDDLVLPPAPPSMGRNRSGGPSDVGSSRRSGRLRTMVNPAFTNERIADQALRDFGSGNGEPFTFEQFQNWAQQTPAVQALLQGAFPTDSHFSLATSPRARKASCDSLVHETPARRASFGPTSASDAAATAMATVVGWTASRPGSRQSTPKNSFVLNSQPQQLQQPTGDMPESGAPSATGRGWGFFASAEPAVARTPSRTHSRNTSYDNLLRSPIVGQGIAAESPMPRGGRTPAGGGRTPRASQSESGGVAMNGGGGDGGRPLSSKRRSTGGGDEKSAAAASKIVWRWGDGPDVDGGRASSGGRNGGSRSSSGRKGIEDAAPAAAAAGTPKADSISAAGMTVSDMPPKKNWDVPPPLTCGRIRRRDPTQILGAYPSPLEPGHHGVGGGDALHANVAMLRRSTSEITGNMPLPPLGKFSPISERELSGKARKLARMARVAGSDPMSCQDLVALSLAENGTAAPAHDGGLSKTGGGAEGEGKRRSIRGSLRPILRHSRSFSHVEGTKLGRSALKKFGTPSVEKRRATAKVGNKSDQARVRGDPVTEFSLESRDLSVVSSKDGKGGVSMTPRSAAALEAGAMTPGQEPSHDQQSPRDTNQTACSPLNMAMVMGRAGAGASTPSRRDSGTSGLDGAQTPANGASDLVAGIGTPTLQSLGLGTPVEEVAVPAELIAGGDAAAANAISSTLGAEAVVRDTLYNSHGIVALDGYLWKPGSMRVVKRWMMLVDNTLYYFVKPGDKKPRGVISLPGCVAEPADDDESVVGDTQSECSGNGARKEPRKNRVPKGFYGLRLLRPNNHGKDNSCRLFLAKTPEERDEWVAELRVASRVVPLEEHFELKALLRKGAFASVHRGIQKGTGDEYAIKVIDKTSLSSHEKSLLRGEIGALKLVSHPNVVRLEAVHEDPRSISIVMTLCRGGDLWDKVRAQPNRCFTISQARTVMRPLCEAVLYLHDLGILHRDIKPENILLVENSQDNGCLSGVILSDFGFSHQVSPKSRLACGKQLMGTPSYMAPESILHGMYGKEVDWFACGCVLYMMLMGRAPFAGANPSEIFRNTCNGRLGLGRGGANHWDRLPSGARDLIVGLMQLDHNLRLTGDQAMCHPWLARSVQQPPEDEAPAPEKRQSGSGRRQSKDGEAIKSEKRRHRGERRSSRGSSSSTAANGTEKFPSDDGHQTPPNIAGSQASTSCASSASSTGGGGGHRDTERDTAPPGIAEGEIMA